MLDAKGRDIGEPIVRVHNQKGTQEEVVRNQRNFEKALSYIYNEINGFPTEVTLFWEYWNETAAY